MSITCKGDWMLGSACGTCSRCVELAKPTIEHLREIVSDQQQRLVSLIGCLPPGGHGFDFSDDFKIKCFEEARRVATSDRVRR